MFCPSCGTQSLPDNNSARIAEPPCHRRVARKVYRPLQQPIAPPPPPAAPPPTPAPYMPPPAPPQYAPRRATGVSAATAGYPPYPVMAARGAEKRGRCGRSLGFLSRSLPSVPRLLLLSESQNGHHRNQGPGDLLRHGHERPGYCAGQCAEGRRILPGPWRDSTAEDKESGSTIISYVVQDGTWNDPKMVADFEVITQGVASTVGGRRSRCA